MFLAGGWSCIYIFPKVGLLLYIYNSVYSVFAYCMMGIYLFWSINSRDSWSVNAFFEQKILWRSFMLTRRNTLQTFNQVNSIGLFQFVIPNWIPKLFDYGDKIELTTLDAVTWILKLCVTFKSNCGRCFIKTI